MKETFTLDIIGYLRSELRSLQDAPKQGDEGNYAAWLELKPEFLPALLGIQLGDRLIILSYLHLAQRDILQVHPRDNLENPLTGVFITRSQDRPNPIGLHEVRVLEIAENRIKLAPLETIDGTPVLDIKPVLTEITKR